MGATILLVEDEKDLAEPIQMGLTEEGFDVKVASTGAEACRFLNDPFDLVVLDLMLPDMSGESVLSFLKQSGYHPPVIVLTARSNLDDKLSLFQKGCDDFMSKPFEFTELLHRIRALLRRSVRTVPDQYAYEDMSLDPVTYRLVINGKDLILTPKEAAICRLLLAAPEQIVSRREILHCVWGHKEESLSNPIGVHIFNLRKKLASLGKGDWFHTIRSAGFMIAKPELVVNGS